MKVYVIYDSLFGNTEKIAKVISKTLNGTVLYVNKVNLSYLTDMDLLIIGSPVHGGRATPAIDMLLAKMTAHMLHKRNVAVFDTRFAAIDHGIGIRILMSVIRYAAERMAKVLTQKGAHLVVKPEGFIVEDKQGPLKDGETERAIQWALQIENTVRREKVRKT